MRQARWFGSIWLLIGFAALLWPWILSMLIASPIAALWIYGVAILADLALFVLWLLQAMRYSQRAGNGDLFEIPWLTRATGTASRKK